MSNPLLGLLTHRLCRSHGRGVREVIVCYSFLPRRILGQVRQRGCTIPPLRYSVSPELGPVRNKIVVPPSRSPYPPAVSITRSGSQGDHSVLPVYASPDGRLSLFLMMTAQNTVLISGLRASMIIVAPLKRSAMAVFRGSMGSMGPRVDILAATTRGKSCKHNIIAARSSTFVAHEYAFAYTETRCFSCFARSATPTLCNTNIVRMGRRGQDKPGNITLGCPRVRQPRVRPTALPLGPVPPLHWQWGPPVRPPLPHSTG